MLGIVKKRCRSNGKTVCSMLLPWVDSRIIHHQFRGQFYSWKKNYINYFNWYICNFVQIQLCLSLHGQSCFDNTGNQYWYLSYSRANSSWPILGISGCISRTDESDATLSHDSARRIAGGISASDAKNRSSKKHLKGVSNSPRFLYPSW